MAILAVNAGSSTLKFSLYPLLGAVVQNSLLSGSIQGLEPGGSPMLDWTFAGQRHSRALPATQEDHFAQALGCLGELLAANAALPALKAVAHRVVHGGEHFSASVLVTDETWRSSHDSTRWRHCTSRKTCRASERFKRLFRRYRRSPVLTPLFTRHWTRWTTTLPCHLGWRRKGCGAMAFMACLTST